jgi:Zn-dependent protease
MTAYNWPKIMEMKSNEELVEITETNPEGLDHDGLLMAEAELKKRFENGQFELNKEPKFPEKPILDHKNQSYHKSILSAIIFIAAFYFIFNWELSSILILSGVLLIHELGHLLAMKAFNYKDLNMFFIPLLGAAAFGTKKDISQKQKLFISLAGPLSGIIIGSFIYAHGYAADNDLYIRIGNMFIYLNLFNLIPVMPLDGGRMIKDLFFYKKEKISIIFLWISIACLIILSIKMEAFLMLIIPVFLFTQISVQTEYKKIRQVLIDKGFDINKAYEDLSNEEYWLLRDELALNMKTISRIVDPKRYIQVANEKIVVNSLKQILQNPSVKKLSTGGKVFFILLWISAFLIPFLVLAASYILGLIEM